MKKEQLLQLSRQVSEIAEIENPIIVGSQSLYAVTGDVPELVKRSIECDFLLLNAKPEVFRAIIAEIGFASEFQEQFGYFADALGLATVVLPAEWEERLHPLTDENGNLVARCLEIHDLAVSKMMAGREKDFEFLREIFERGLFDFEIFTNRVKSILEMPPSAAVVPRINAFKTYLQKFKSASELKRYLRLLERELKNQRRE